MPETPRFGHVPIQMRAAKDDFDDLNALGDFFIFEDGKSICMAHPSPTGQGWTYIQIPLYRQGEEKPAPAAWLWDGNTTAPTLSPSIHTHGHWHGFVQAGKMVEA